MKFLRGIFSAAVVLLLLAPAVVAAQDVKTDYDHKANFERYHTFSFYRVKTASPLFEQRVRDQISRDLQARGWQMVPSGGDIAITAIGDVRSEAEYNTFYTGLGGGFGWRHWGWWGGRAWGPGETTTTVEQIPVGTLLIDLYDTNTHQLVFRGSAHEDISHNPEKNIGKVNRAIDKIFEHFPPKMR